MVAFLWQEAPNIGTEEQVRLSQGALSLAWVLVVHVVKKGKKEGRVTGKGMKTNLILRLSLNVLWEYFPPKLIIVDGNLEKVDSADLPKIYQ